MIKNLVFSFQKQLKKNDKSEFPIIVGFFIGAVRNLKRNTRLTMIGKMGHIAGCSHIKNIQKHIKGEKQMVFECMRCGRRFEPKGFESTGTFYTICEECGEEVLTRITKKMGFKV